MRNAGIVTRNGTVIGSFMIEEGNKVTFSFNNDHSLDAILERAEAHSDKIALRFAPEFGDEDE